MKNRRQPRSAADVEGRLCCEHFDMFVDRKQAGRLLAQLLDRFAGEHPVVLALPRGGVPVGVEIARALHAPLDVLAVRKIGAPGNPELAVGALAEEGTAIVDRAVAARVGMTQAQLLQTIRRESHELRRRVATYRGDRPLIDLEGRVVILADDGLATGLTQLAAIRAARALGAAKVLVAVPVAARASIARTAREADELICHTVPRELLGVSRWYEDFSPVGDGEVLRLLRAQLPADGAQLATDPPQRRAVAISAPQAVLAGELVLPHEPRGLVIFAHGCRSSRRSPRNRAVAEALCQDGFATLLVDLLSDEETWRREQAFDIALLASRLELVTRWALEEPATTDLPIGLFGASTGAAAALRTAVAVGEPVRAVVSRGGRPDLAARWLPAVTAPTLLIVGGLDREVLALNRKTMPMLRAPHRLSIIENASHLFGEPGKLEQVEAITRDWFATWLQSEARLPALAGFG